MSYVNTKTGERARELPQEAVLDLETLATDSSRSVFRRQAMFNSGLSNEHIGNGHICYLPSPNADAEPWYLRAEHGAKDVLIKPDGAIRGGILPALIERLTRHDNPGKSQCCLVAYCR
jgi:hypothetical protein